MQPFESINGLTLSPQVESRLRELIGRQGVGRLNADERRELDLLLKAQALLAEIRAKAKAAFDTASPPAPGRLLRIMRNGLPVMQVPAGTPAIDPVAVRRFLEEEAF